MQPSASFSFVVKAAVAATCIFSSAAAAAVPATDSVAARQITIDPGQLEALANYISSARNQIISIRNEIDSQSAAVLSSWAGSGAENYRNQLSSFDVQISGATDRMNDLANALRI